MTRSGGDMLGVGGTRRNLGRKALRGGRQSGRIGGGTDPAAQKRDLLRRFQEKQQEQEQGQGQEGEQEQEGATAEESS